MSIPASALPAVRRSSKRTAAEDLFAFHCRARRLPDFERNHRFALVIGRRWHFDFAWVKERVAVEVEGLVVRRIGGELVCTGRHASVAGFKEDCIKYATAATLGWHVLRFEQSQVTSGEAIDFTIRMLDRIRRSQP